METAQLTAERIGHEIHALASEIFPINRSITGDGVRRTLNVLQRHAPIEIREIASGTEVLDWTVPREWNVTEAYIRNERGEKVVDFSKNNLHLLSYSVPVRATMSFATLKPHLFTLPEQPDLIPYRTSFYRDAWGFCLSHRQMEELERAGGEYEVVIDSRLEPGALSWGECFIEGESPDEVLVSTHICHPSLANDNCSGLALCALLAREIGAKRPRLSHRFVFVPATIGSICWLATNEARVDRIKHGLVVSNVGDAGAPTFKRSRRGDALIDRAVSHVFRQSGKPHEIRDFIPYGYDERQYCSPGFDLPVGLFQRSHYGTFPEYHTSADNLDFIRPEYLGDSFALIAAVLQVLEKDARFMNLHPRGEPQLGKRGLYTAGTGKHSWNENMAVLWVLNQSDGRHSLLEIAERAGLPFATIADAASRLERGGMLAKCEPSSPA